MPSYAVLYQAAALCLTYPDDEAEFACLQALISSTLALARGRVELVAVPRDLIEGALSRG